MPLLNILGPVEEPTFSDEDDQNEDRDEIHNDSPGSWERDARLSHRASFSSARQFLDEEAFQEDEDDKESDAEDQDQDQRDLSGFIDDSIVYEEDDEDEEDEEDQGGGEEEEDDQEPVPGRLSIANLVALQIESDAESFRPRDSIPECRLSSGPFGRGNVLDLSEESDEDEDEDQEYDDALLEKVAQIAFGSRSATTHEDCKESAADCNDSVQPCEIFSDEEGHVVQPPKRSRRIVIEEDEDEDEDEDDLPNFTMAPDQRSRRSVVGAVLSHHNDPAKENVPNDPRDRFATVAPKTTPSGPISRPCKHSTTSPSSSSLSSSSTSFQESLSSSLSLACGLRCNDQRPLKPLDRLKLICPAPMTRHYFDQYRHEIANSLYKLFNETIFGSRLPVNLVISW